MPMTNPPVQVFVDQCVRQWIDPEKLLDATPDVICSLDADGRFVSVTAAAKKLWGYQPDELIGRPYMDFVLPEDRARTAAMAEAIMAGAEVTNFQNRYRRKDGAEVPVLWSARWDNCSRLMYGVAKNATEKVEAEKQAKAREEKLYRAYRLSRIGWWEWNEETRDYAVSDELFEIYGLDKNTCPPLTLRYYLSLVHPDDLHQVITAIRESRQRQYSQCDHRMITPKGEVIYVIHYVECVKTESGTITQVHGTTKNITERKLQQEALNESNQRYGYVTKATSDAIWDWDLATGTVHWGEGFHTNFGHQLAARQSFIQTWINYVHPDDIERVTKGLDRLIESTTETNWIEEYRCRKADGTYAHVIDKGFVIRNANGKGIRMVGAMQDITRQKEAELAIKLSEEHFRLLFSLSPKPKCIVRTADWQIVEVNEAAIALYGYTRNEFLALRVPDLKLKEDLSELDALATKQLEQDQRLVRHVKKNGEVFPIELAMHAIELPTGRHYIVTGDDVTEKLRLQQELIEEKISAQKEVARVILDTQEQERSEIGKELHDNVNQLLTTAKLYIENIHYFPDQIDDFVSKGVQLLQKTIHEIRLLSKQLVTPVMSDIGFEATIEELISHYRSLQLFEIDLHYAVCEKLLDKGLKLTIYRIIQEQLNNIVKYAKASLVRVAVQFCDGELQVVISDNGVGFDCSKLSQGLGLKNMKHRAEMYKGHVDIRSSPGNGSIITTGFPAFEREETA
jgi:PAS domain S-box-containing protein